MAQIILDSNNNLIQGDFDNATINNRTKFKTTTTNATTNVYAVPNGSATSAGFTVTNAADPTNASKLTIATNGSTDTQIISGVNGSGTYLPLSFYTNNALGAQLDTSGNFFATGKMGGVGSVIQVVNAVYNTQGSRNTNTLADTGLTASITPTSSSNKILVLVTQHFCTVTDNVVQFRVLRSSTTLIDSIDVLGSQTGGTLLGTVGFNYLDSPATTSSITYKTQYCSRDVGETVYVNIDSNTSTLTLMEIKA